MRFSYSVLASPLHDAVAVERITDGVRRLLDAAGGAVVAPDPVAIGPHLVVLATGGTERACLELLDRRDAVAPGLPAVLVAHGGHNSLPAALEALAAVHQRGRHGRIVWSEGDDARRVLDETIADLDVLHRLRTTRIGLVGGPSDWLVASSPTPEAVAARWGATVAVIEPDRLLADQRGSETAVRLSGRFARASTATTVAPGEVDAAAEVGAALAETVGQERLDAVAVRCFDLLSSAATSGCIALAALNDDRIVAGCEGDIPSTLAMLLVRHVLDQPSWMANPARLDPATDRLELAHCTIAPSMVRDYHLSTHFESGIGVGIGGHFEPQPVTLLRIGGVDLDRRWIAEGHIVGSGDDADLCRTQATVALVDTPVTDLLARPLGNHLVLTTGHHRRRLEQWWSLAFGDDGEPGGDRR